MLQTDFAVYIGIVYSYLPFMILPLYANLEKHGPDAARGGGGPRLRRRGRRSCKITLPLSMPGIVAGCHAGVHPGGRRVRHPVAARRPDQLMIGTRAVDEFFNNRDWPVASAVAIALLLFLVCRSCCSSASQNARAGGSAAMSRPRPMLFRTMSLVFGFAFLYIPILSLIVYSFNDSRLVTVWGGLPDAQVVRRAAAQPSRSWTPPGSAVEDRGHQRPPVAVDARHAGRAGAGALRPVPRPRRCCRA